MSDTKEEKKKKKKTKKKKQKQIHVAPHPTASQRNKNKKQNKKQKQTRVAPPAKIQRERAQFLKKLERETQRVIETSDSSDESGDASMQEWIKEQCENGDVFDDDDDGSDASSVMEEFGYLPTPIQCDRAVVATEPERGKKKLMNGDQDALVYVFSSKDPISAQQRCAVLMHESSEQVKNWVLGREGKTRNASNILLDCTRDTITTNRKGPLSEVMIGLLRSYGSTFLRDKENIEIQNALRFHGIAMATSKCHYFKDAFEFAFEFAEKPDPNYNYSGEFPHKTGRYVWSVDGDEVTLEPAELAVRELSAYEEHERLVKSFQNFKYKEFRDEQLECADSKAALNRAMFKLQDVQAGAEELIREYTSFISKKLVFQPCCGEGGKCIHNGLRDKTNGSVQQNHGGRRQILTTCLLYLAQIGTQWKNKQEERVGGGLHLQVSEWF